MSDGKTVVVGKKGRITIPYEIREKMDISEDSSLSMKVVEKDEAKLIVLAR